MSEYDINLAERLANATPQIAKQELKTVNSIREAIHRSYLSMEIALKALLEKAGVAISEIPRNSHDIHKLLKDLETKCEIYDEIAPNYYKWRRATTLRAVTINNEYSNCTVGTIFEAERNGASKYPQEILRGDQLRHYPVDAILGASRITIDWVKNHWNTIRLHNK